MKQISYLAIIILFISCATSKSHKDATDINKWKKAVVYIEYTTLNFIELEKKNKPINNYKNYSRFHGTAIFLKYNGGFYLLTARHVVHDINVKNEADRIREANKKNADITVRIREETKARKLDYRIAQIIVRGRTYDEYLKDPNKKPAYINYDDPKVADNTYTFSDPETDLAVISLNQDSTSENFKKDLLGNGYFPIESEDISPDSTREGDDIMAIGFPSTSLFLRKIDRKEIEEPLVFPYDNSLPSITFGKVALNHPSLTFLWCDVSVLPGNSGGPIIYRNKLIGIVSQQALAIVNGSDEMTSRAPVAQVRKVSSLIPLIKIQEGKDLERRQSNN